MQKMYEALPHGIGIRLSFFFVLILSCTVHFSLGQDTLRVFLYAGQSNAQGTNKNKQSFSYPSNSADSNIKFAWNLGGGRTVNDRIWDTLQAAPLNPTRVSHAGEIEFARQVYAAGMDQLAIIKVTKAGTSIHVPWDPEGNSTQKDGGGHGGMYTLLVNFVKKKLASLDEQGIPYKVEALLWHQGERDATPEASVAYEEGLGKFIDSLRADLGGQVQVYLASIYNPKKDAASVVRIREAQENMVKLKKGVFFVNLDSVYFDAQGDLNAQYMFDNIHYNSEGYFKVGETFAQAYLAQQSSSQQNNPTELCNLCTEEGFPVLLDDLLASGPRILVLKNPSRSTFSLNILLPPGEEGRLSFVNRLGQKVGEFEIRTSQKILVGENFSRGLYWAVWNSRDFHQSLKLLKID